MASTKKDPAYEKLRYEVPPSREEAEALQRELKKKVITTNDFEKIETLAGVDIVPSRDGDTLICGIIVFTYPELKEIERVSAEVNEQFPYIPGLLAFREGPSVVEAYDKLKKKPDLIIIDGQGIAHPRGFGIASHVGIILDIPSIGVAKTRLFGFYKEPPKSNGAWTPLTSKGKTIGAVVRTKKGAKPVFVSIGHKIDLATSVRITLGCTKGYRLPEPTRQADIFVAQLKTTRR